MSPSSLSMPALRVASLLARLVTRALGGVRPDRQQVFGAGAVLGQLPGVLLPEGVDLGAELLQAPDLDVGEAPEQGLLPGLDPVQLGAEVLLDRLVGVVAHPLVGQQEVVDLVVLARLARASGGAGWR